MITTAIVLPVRYYPLSALLSTFLQQLKKRKKERKKERKKGDEEREKGKVGRRRRRDERWNKNWKRRSLSCSSCQLGWSFARYSKRMFGRETLSGEPTRPVKWDTTFDHISRRKKILLPRICYESVYPETGCSSFHKPRKHGE